MPKVKLKNRKEFEAAPDTFILNEAQKNSLTLEYSCKTGRCGVCKARVITGDTKILQSEAALTPSEQAEGFILTCCRSAVSDVELNIGDIGRIGSVKIKTLPCRIDALTPLSDDIMHVLLRLPPNSSLDYIAGQYVDIIGANGVRRSYSLASTKRSDAKLEFHIRKVPNGAMSHYWFSNAKVNDILRIEGPLGTFSLRSSTFDNIIFLGTGTGIAPIKAMLGELALDSEATANRHVHVYWGGRTPQDIYENFHFSNFNFTYVPSLSRKNSAWSGRVGYVQNCVIEDGVEISNAVVYACGSEAMIHSARTLFTAHGLDPQNFYSDAFVSSN